MGWLVEIVRWGLKLRCSAKFTQIFRPEDGLPASCTNAMISYHSIDHRTGFE